MRDRESLKAPQSSVVLHDFLLALFAVSSLPVTCTVFEEGNRVVARIVLVTNGRISITSLG